jgi:hypothetical protein
MFGSKEEESTASAEKLQTEEPGDWHDQIEDIWWTGDFGICGGENKCSFGRKM